jgi:hypothetical protein
MTNHDIFVHCRHAFYSFLLDSADRHYPLKKYSTHQFVTVKKCVTFERAAGAIAGARVTAGAISGNPDAI